MLKILCILGITTVEALRASFSFQQRQQQEETRVDIVMSSGFCCFSSHVGFVQALEEKSVKPSAIVGTSCGALIGGMLAAGYSANDISSELSQKLPIDELKLNKNLPRRGGVLSLDGVIKRLAKLLPPKFEDLPIPLAIGVCQNFRKTQLLTSGDLPAAVAASCAVPGLFSPVQISGRTFSDAAGYDRTFLRAWRTWRGDNVFGICNLVKNDGAPIFPHDGIQNNHNFVLVRTPRTRSATLWNLGNFHQESDLAKQRTLSQLSEFRHISSLYSEQEESDFHTMRQKTLFHLRLE